MPVGVTDELEVTTLACNDVFEVSTSPLANAAVVPVVPELMYLIYSVFIFGLLASAPSSASTTNAFTPVVPPVSSDPMNAAVLTVAPV